ncbi:MAG: nucleotidyl transferase AbiEii/AbiGii toxin family protein [Clostridia bacterium]
MYKIAIVQDDEREVLFLNTASKIGMNAAIVEKDFWVCLILDYLFHKCKYRDAFAFKGGTSLSKAYNLIDRFSEDIDLILDWRLLGYTTNEPWMPRSNAKQQKFIDDSRDRLFFFIANEFMAEFKKT